MILISLSNNLKLKEDKFNVIERVVCECWKKKAIHHLHKG